MYADFEALLEKIQKHKSENILAFENHSPMSYDLYVKVSKNVSIYLLEQYEIDQIPILDRGCESREEVTKYFVETVVEIARKDDKLLKTNTLIIMTDDEER